MKPTIATTIDAVGVGSGVLAAVSVNEITAICALICSAVCALAAIGRFIASIIRIIKKWRAGHIDAEAAANAIDEAANKLESEVKNNAKRN